MTRIPYGKQSISADDISAVVQVLHSEFLTQGPVVRSFEDAFRAKAHSQYAVATNSATSALHLACLALGVGSGDIVWTSAITFVASANCAAYCGARVEFVDIDEDSFNMSTKALRLKLEKARELAKLPKVLIPVHMTGQPCDMKEIKTLAEEFGFSIIEDASHAVGANYMGSPVGACEFSDITVFSFHPVKIITTAEGGMATTNNPELASKMARLRSHGITRDPNEMKHPPEGPWYYEQLDLGFNYRLTDIQAALGLSQLDRLDSFVRERHEIAKIYDSLFEGSEVKRPTQISNRLSSLHLYVVRISETSSLGNRGEVFERLRASGIGVNVHYLPVYRHPFYEHQGGYEISEFTAAEKYYSEAISIPIYPGLTPEQQAEIVEIILTPLGHQTIF